MAEYFCQILEYLLVDFIKLVCCLEDRQPSIDIIQSNHIISPHKSHTLRSPIIYISENCTIKYLDSNPNIWHGHIAYICYPSWTQISLHPRHPLIFSWWFWSLFLVWTPSPWCSSVITTTQTCITSPSSWSKPLIFLFSPSGISC